MTNETSVFLPVLIFVLGQHINAGEANQNTHAGTCGLVGLDPDTSPTNRITLPSIPDNLQSGTRAWENPLFGLVDRVTIDSTGHQSYLTGSYNSNKYWMSANTKTKDFVKEQNTRIMIRYITTHCEDLTSTKYHFEIPIQDVDPPVFAEDEYTFNIASDWNLDRPISEGQFVIVSDNDIELEDLKGSLEFVASQEIIRVVTHPLWVLPYPERYYFRLDLFLKDETVVLLPGQNIQINLSARDKFNSGTTKIIINVSN